MRPAFQNRNSDAPLIRFLPKGEARQRQISGARAVRAFSYQEVTILEDAARRLEATLECLLLAGFACWLSRLTHQEALVISIGGGDVAVLSVDGERPFRDVVRQSRLNRELESQYSGEGAGQGIYFLFQPQDDPLTDNPSIDAQAGIRLIARKEGLELELNSSSGEWDEPTLRSWLGFLETLLGVASANPDLTVSQLPLWDESAARLFYQNLNRTDVEFPGEPSVIGRFQAQARRRPDAPAVVAGFSRYSYKELDERSTDLAKLLVSAGAGPGRAVAICMERSVDLPMSILAVLKSGGFYVPLDSRNPTERLRGIIEECAPIAVLSDAAVIAGVQKIVTGTSIPLICVDQAWPKFNESQSETLGVSRGSDLAYTIYTSGTTGKPKGVAIHHAALLNLICSIWRQPGITEADQTLAVAPISFDIATMDMLLPICSGGTLVLASRRDSVDPYRLAQLIEEHAITFMQATPVTWRMLITSGWKGKRSLKMISGGEALPRELANTLCRMGGELWNCYGPTETTIYSGVIQITQDSGIVPVGGPIANTSFYVMDNTGFPVPPGVPGELYIGGIGVSPGYVGRPELTAERFVTDNWGHELSENDHAEADSAASQPRKTLFRTGDLVRVVEGNRLEFFGRLDHQVKLRGFRIELEEIEAVLRSHPSIRDAVVVLREDLPGEPRLVAYVVPSGVEVVGFDAREYAARTLPEYMIPTVIVTLDQFPLSTSGKIDRKSLPLPESVPGQNVADHPESTAAADDLEAKLLKIFREVLRHNSIGVTDNFFHYGGYSLLTMRLFSRIDRELKVRLPISLLFDAPTVRELAGVIRKGVAPSVIVPIRPYGNSAPMFVIQSYLLYNAMLEIVESDRPVYGVRELGEEREPISVEERARRFAQEILAVSPHGPLYLAGWCAAGTLTVEIARQLRENGHDVGLVALFDAEHPAFTLPSGPSFWFSRLRKKVVFHIGRLERIPWGKKFTYITEALERNWEWLVESYYTRHFSTMLWLHKRFGLSLSEAAFNNVYASLSSIKDFSDRPYPGKLNLFRASDVPDLAELDTTLGWSTIAQGGVEVNFVPGDHVSMFKKPHIDSLARRLQQEIRKSELDLIRT